jgi:hypothetical protein
MGVRATSSRVLALEAAVNLRWLMFVASLRAASVSVGR